MTESNELKEKNNLHMEIKAISILILTTIDKQLGRQTSMNKSFSCFIPKKTMSIEEKDIFV